MKSSGLLGFRTALAIHDECDRLGCHRNHDDRVILADTDRVSRQLCPRHQREFKGVSL